MCYLFVCLLGWNKEVQLACLVDSELVDFGPVHRHLPVGTLVHNRLFFVRQSLKFLLVRQLQIAISASIAVEGESEEARIGRFCGGLQHNGASTIPEQNASSSIAPIQETRQSICSNDKHLFVGS